MAVVFLGFGANLGDRESSIKTALALLGRMKGIEISKVSSLYETTPIGVSGQPNFINCVAKIITDLEPLELLKALKFIEQNLGRKLHTHMQPRVIDIDILIYDSIDMLTEDLVIPHSRLKSRRFVLEPLLEIEPDARDPQTSRPLKEFLPGVMDQKVAKVADSPESWGG